VSPDGGDARPLPRAAYEQWLDSLASAGWSPRCGRPGDGGARGGQDSSGQDGDRSSERVALREALGRVTAAPAVARWPSPRAACAAMDGIAVRAADLAAAPAAGGRAGGGATRLPAGMFEWIDTGDPMPAAADTVVMRERLLPQADGSVVISPAQAARGQHVRTAGEDFTAGQTLVPAGRRLRPGDLAAAAAGGHLTLCVARQPAVTIIPTGDEIRPVGAVLGPGDITDTNSLMLAARCRQLDAAPAVSAVVPDDPDALAAELRRAAPDADLMLVIAGSSRGRGDHTAAVLAQVGGVAVAGVAIRPGHPALLGHVKRAPAGAGPRDQADTAPVIGLPGYPLATAVIFELFAMPLLAALQGRTPARDWGLARLDRDWASPADVEDWVLVTLSPPSGAGLPLAAPARRGAGSISQLARADAWWPIPAGQGNFPAGTQIKILPIAATS
jgi:putative molybdopterin biosynthesis protein